MLSSLFQVLRNLNFWLRNQGCAIVPIGQDFRPEFARPIGKPAPVNISFEARVNAWMIFEGFK